MAEDSRITVETVQRHITPDGRKFDTEREAASHLAFLDRQEREVRVKDALESGFWKDELLQARYEHSASEFADKAYDLINGNIEDILALAPMLQEIKEAWDGPQAVQPEKPAEPAAPAKPGRRQGRDGFRGRDDSAHKCR